MFFQRVDVHSAFTWACEKCCMLFYWLVEMHLFSAVKVHIGRSGGDAAYCSFKVM